jgi:hypothetical protein
MKYQVRGNNSVFSTITSTGGGGGGGCSYVVDLEIQVDLVEVAAGL